MVFTEEKKTFIKIFVPDYMNYGNLWESHLTGWKRSGLDNLIMKLLKKVDVHCPSTMHDNGLVILGRPN